MRELLSDVLIVKNMDMLLQYVEESEDMGGVIRATTMWRCVNEE